jgi:hypothetical protein
MPVVRASLFLLFSFLFCGSHAQRIIAFNIYPVDGKVTGRFTISAGPACSEYRVMHSTDSIIFNTIETGGQCGNFNTSEEKSFTHATPAMNRINYYKVVIEPFEVSPVRRVYVAPAGYMTMIVYPNPVGVQSLNMLSLRLVNTNNLLLTGAVYNQQGHPVIQVTQRANGEIVSIDTGSLRNGAYVVWLTDFNQYYNAKFIINR